MTIKRVLLSIAAPIALLGLSGCASDFTAKVSRFQQLPAPQGQTFRIEALNPRDSGGLEFATYAQGVSQHLAQVGYRPATAGSTADMIVQVGYGVDRGQQKVTTTPGGFGCGYGGWGGPGWRYGWGGPYGGFGCPDVESYTIYSSYLQMQITRADGQRLFEGRARAHSTTDDLTKLVPNLVDAMFAGFPGNSGQDIRITIPANGGPPKMKG
jgi:hypothetical protein